MTLESIKQQYYKHLCCTGECNNLFPGSNGCATQPLNRVFKVVSRNLPEQSCLVTLSQNIPSRSYSIDLTKINWKPIWFLVCDRLQALYRCPHSVTSATALTLCGLLLHCSSSSSTLPPDSPACLTTLLISTTSLASCRWKVLMLLHY